MAATSSRKPAKRKPAPKKRTTTARKKPAAASRPAAGQSTPTAAPPARRFVRILARNRVGGRPTSNRFVLVCALEGDRIVDGEWFGKQVYPDEEGGEFGIIVREGCQILYPAGYWRTNIGNKRIVPGELFSVLGVGGRDSPDDVWEITHVTAIAP